MPTIDTPTISPNGGFLTLFVHDEPQALKIPAEANTFDGFRRWVTSDDFPERGKISFLEQQVIVDMSPEYLETHNLIKTEVTIVIGGIVRESRTGLFCSDRVLFSSRVADLATEPDAMFVTYDNLKAGRTELVKGKSQPDATIELLGAPTWVLEIASKSSRKKDGKILPKNYFDAGVDEYWIIDALGKEIEFQNLTRGNDSFVAAQPSDGWHDSPTFGRAFRLERSTDDDGFCQYTLYTKEVS